MVVPTIKLSYIQHLNEKKQDNSSQNLSNNENVKKLHQNSANMEEKLDCWDSKRK